MPSPRLITTRFDGSSTADEVVAGLDLAGLRVVVTGASSGLGLETARSLVRSGASVTLAVRDRRAGTAAAEDIAASTGRPAPPVDDLDLSDPRSVQDFGARWTGPLHVLIANAGIVTGRLLRTAEGRELQFATNHLGHLLLAVSLHGALVAGSAERGGARIVAVSSGAHLRAAVDLDDLDYQRTPYDPQIAYARSKTANILFAVEATRRWVGDGIVANAVNPGGVVTGLQRNFTEQQRASLAAAEAAGVFSYKTPQQGAATTLVAAVAPEFAHVGGLYLDDCGQAVTVPDDTALGDEPQAVKEWALDPDIALRVWTASLELVRTPGTTEMR